MDLIDRQTAIDALDRIFDRCEEIEVHLPEGDPDRTGYKMYPDYMTVWKYLHQLPSAQSEIIRCNECIFYDPDMGECDHRYGLLVANEDSFCSHAGRRNE